MQERSQCCSIQSNADGKWSRNGPKRRNVFADKIGAIFSSACGSSSRRRRASKMSSYTVDEEKESTGGKQGPICEVALNDPSKQMETGRNYRKRHRRRLLSSSLTNIFRRSSTGFTLRKWKAIKIGSANATRTKGSLLKPGFRRIVRKRGNQRGEKTMTWEEDEAGDEGKSEMELCKKRILMGDKCRALNRSGVLHYDNEGILLPEDLFPFEES